MYEVETLKYTWSSTKYSVTHKHFHTKAVYKIHSFISAIQYFQEYNWF